MAQHDLGNWEMAKGTYFPISQMTPAHLAHYYYGNLETGYRHILPNFPKDPSPARWASTFGKLENDYRYIFPNFAISQLPKKSQPIWLSIILGIRKLGNGYRNILPNFPNSQKKLSPSGSALFGKLGNWEMSTGTYFPISQIIPAQIAQHHLGSWEIGRGMHFPISQKTPAQMAQFPERPQPRWPSTIGKLVEV